jgi:RNA polymerase sigma-70 factor (ECF subfamily)
LTEREETRGESREEGENIQELLRPLLDPAYGFCLRLTRNEQDAEDLIQEAALRACRGLESYRPGTNFKAWFFKIIVNAFYERFRKTRPEDHSIGLEDAPAHYVRQRVVELGLDKRYPDPARQLISRLGMEQIEQALQSLPEEYRMVCNMYFIEDFTYREIADMLGIPIGTVRSRLHRGRKLLQKQLWELAVREGIVPRSRGREG